MLTQPHFIQSILTNLGLSKDSSKREIPALSMQILGPHRESGLHIEHWKYRSVIGKLNYLEKFSRPDIAYDVHQCARFSESPCTDHSKAVRLIVDTYLGHWIKGLFAHQSVSQLIGTAMYILVDNGTQKLLSQIRHLRDRKQGSL
jgi:hypothetical protein